MMRWLRHPLFAPALALLALGWGVALNVFLIVGPSLGGWARSVLISCGVWDAAARAYRLDAVLLATLEPPLFALAVALLYTDEVRLFLRRTSGRMASGAAALGFVSAALILVLTGEIVSGTPSAPASSLARDGRPSPVARLTDHHGQAFDLGAALGRPVALTFIYTGCHASCPVLVATLKATHALVGARAVFAAVTLSPERDTVAALAAYGRRLGLGDGWHLLTGRQGQIDALLAAYGVQTVPLPGGEVGHQNVIVVIDRAGRIAYTYRGLGERPEALAATLERLAAERR